MASHLHKLAFGDDETASLKKVLETALMRSVEKLQLRDILESDTTTSEIAGVLRELLGTELVSKALIGAALSGNGDARQLTSLATEAGLDPTTLPFDWNEFLMTLLEELERAIRDEVNSSDSKLRSRVATVDLFQMRCSVAPRQASELRELMRGAFAIDDWSLRDAMDALNRFVIGDGKENGYALSHPRLNEFFGEEPFCDERNRAKIHEVILSWGGETLGRLEQKRFAPDKVPGYLLAHLGEHNAANNVELDQFSKLLGEGWISSWKVSDPTFRGFLMEVQRVWDRAASLAGQASEVATDFHLGLQFRCMLYFGSIGSQYRLPPASIFAAAKDTGLLTARQTLSIIAYRVDGTDFEQVVENIIPVIARDCGPALASLLELRAPSLVKVQLLAKIARQLTDHQQSLVIDKARRASRDCTGHSERVCSALALLRFSPEEKRRKPETLRIVEQLATFREGRIMPDILQDLIAEAPQAAARFCAQFVGTLFYPRCIRRQTERELAVCTPGRRATTWVHRHSPR